MAYYNNLPDKKSKKKHGENDNWEDETSYYRRSGNVSSRRSDNASSSGYDRKNDSRFRTGSDRPAKRPSVNTRKDMNFANRSVRRTSDSKASDMQESAVTSARYERYEYHPVQENPVQNGYETENADNILCGRNPIREALKGERDIEKLMVQSGELSGSAREIVQLAKEKRIPVQVVEKSRLDDIAPHHQGLIAFASAYHYSTIEDMLKLAEERHEAPFLILLDGITDPHNLGAVIRTAECAGAHGVIVPERRSVGLTPAAVKASAGAVEHVPVARVINLGRTMNDLKKRNIWTYAVTMQGTDYEKTDFTGGVALVIGSEGEGISRLVEDQCDFTVSIPMKGQISSLNASVAAGIIMYRVFGCRRK